MDFTLICALVLLVAFAALIFAQRRLILSLNTLVAAKNELVEAQDRLIAAKDARIEVFEKMACCGCGHLLSRHDDPDSADGFGCRDCQCQAIHSLVEELDKDRRVTQADLDRGEELAAEHGWD